MARRMNYDESIAELDNALKAACKRHDEWLQLSRDEKEQRWFDNQLRYHDVIFMHYEGNLVTHLEAKPY